ncbi:MAG: hypothetical protein K8S00_08715 [Bacteroidales bacterium]|nr:hypothetical protein [Bacteroidales bacterium]
MNQYFGIPQLLYVCHLLHIVKPLFYPSFDPTYEWDTGAGHAIAKGAGKKVVQTDMTTTLEYNKENLLNPFFIVSE